MIAAFDEVRKMFEMRSWIMEGRGSYAYNDDRYKEEVRLLYEEFDDLQKRVWNNIRTKTAEYRNKIIASHIASTPPTATPEAAKEILDKCVEANDGKLLLEQASANITHNGISYQMINRSVALMAMQEFAAQSTTTLPASTALNDGWISVEERLPEKRVDVIWFITNPDYMAIECLDHNNSWLQANCHRGAVTHWHPLPTPPKK